LIRDKRFVENLPMLDPADEIRGYVRRFASPAPDELDAFIARGRRGLLHKGEALTRQGEREHRLAFLHTGIVRYHVIVPDTGEEVTKDFGFAPGFAVSFGSAVLGQPARVAVSAVEDCVATFWPAGGLRELLEQGGVEWQRFGRKVAEWLYVRKEDRELAFLTEDADARYDAMLAQFGPVAARIPQHLLASYLGITPESLSRLKRRRNG
jgi:CRP-like cAMP-binding protein